MGAAYEAHAPLPAGVMLVDCGYGYPAGADQDPVPTFLRAKKSLRDPDFGFMKIRTPVRLFCESLNGDPT